MVYNGEFSWFAEAQRREITLSLYCVFVKNRVKFRILEGTFKKR